jgi:WhiB family redox-sensing transcriptional regulator
MRPSTAWEALAACKGRPVALFYPEPSISVEPAKRICRGCPVRQACLVAGLNERHGVWGGMTRNERAALLRDARKARAA